MINQLRRIPVLLQLILLFGLSAGIILFPLFIHSTFMGGPDVGTHIFSAQQFSNAMREGVWYPRWLRDWYGGYGAPIGVAYPPLLYYCVGILGLMGIQTIFALKIIIWISLTLSGVFTYKLVRLNGGALGAVAAALFYQAAPYRLIDLYERTALPEYLAFLWIPIITYLALKWVQEKKIVHLLFLALSFAGLICTHSMIAYIFGFFILGLLVYTLAIPEALSSRLKSFIGMGLAFVLGGMIAAIYIVPALVESQYMFPEWLSAGGANMWGNYRNNFIFAAQIYKSTPLEGLYTENIYIGLTALLCVLIAIIAAVFVRMTWKQRPIMSRNITLLMIVTVVISVLMSSSVSSPLWTILPKSENIAFPWRWQTLTVFASSYLVGDVVNTLASYSFFGSRQSLMVRRLVIGFVGICIVASFVFGSLFIWRGNHSFMPQDTIDQLTASTPLEATNYEWVFDEPYLPHWSKDFDYTSNPSTLKPVVLDSATDLKINEWHSQERLLSVSTTAESDLNVRTFWFPGWVALVNNKPTPIDISPADGTMMIHVPAGTSDVELKFENTQIRDVSTAVSLVGILGALLVTGYVGYDYTRRNSNSAVHVAIYAAIVASSAALWLLKGQWWFQGALVVFILGMFYFGPQLSVNWKRPFITFVSLVVIVYAGFILNSLRSNIANPPEWDFQAFWLDGRVASQRVNIYDPQNYVKEVADANLSPSPDFQIEKVDVAFSYPPPTAFLMMPLGWFSLKTAQIVWYGFHIIILILTVFRLWQMFFAEYGSLGLVTVAALLLVFDSTRQTFVVAQTGILLLFCLLSFWQEKKPVRAGIWLALAVLIKPIAAVVILYPFVRRQWRLLISTLLTLLSLSIVFVAVFGLQTLLSYRVSPPLPAFVYTETVNQSLLATILRITHYDLTVHSPLSNPIFLISAFILLVISAWLVYRLPDQARQWGIGLVIVLGLLLYPATLNHYAVLLLPALLLAWVSRSKIGWGNWGVLIFISIVYGIVGYNDGSMITFAFLLCWISVAGITFWQAKKALQPSASQPV